MWTSSRPTTSRVRLAGKGCLATPDEAGSFVTGVLVSREETMALHHSEETHQMLVARIPAATGRPLHEWFGHLENGPGCLRFDERVQWLREEYNLSHGHATAIVHEHDLVKAHRSFE
jgi:hypothetical protein